MLVILVVALAQGSFVSSAVAAQGAPGSGRGGSLLLREEPENDNSRVGYLLGRLRQHVFNGCANAAETVKGCIVGAELRFLHAGSQFEMDQFLGEIRGEVEPSGLYAFNLNRDPTTVTAQETGMMKLGPGTYCTTFASNHPLGMDAKNSFWLHKLNPRKSRAELPKGLVFTPSQEFAPTVAFVPEELFYGNWWDHADGEVGAARYSCMATFDLRFIVWPRTYLHKVPQWRGCQDAMQLLLNRLKAPMHGCAAIPYIDFKSLVTQGCVSEVVMKNPVELVGDKKLLMNGMVTNDT